MDWCELMKNNFIFIRMCDDRPANDLASLNSGMKRRLSLVPPHQRTYLHSWSITCECDSRLLRVFTSFDARKKIKYS